MMLRESQTAITKRLPTREYQCQGFLNSNPKTVKGSTIMPSGPPVNWASWFRMMEMISPMPKVAMAR